MIVLAVVALLVGQLILASVLHALIRRHGRERERLINQICHLAGKPWHPAPADEPPPRVEVPAELPALVVAPEQLADDDLY